MQQSRYSLPKALFCLIFTFQCLVLNAQGPDAFSAKLSRENHFDYAFPTNHGLFKVRQQKKYTFVDSTGKIAPGWQWFDFVDNFWQGIARVRLGDRWGICNAEGQLTIPLQYNAVNFVYEDYLAWFDQNGKWGLANGISGEVLIPAAFDAYYSGYYYTRIFIVEKQGLEGLIDSTGHWIAPPSYEWIGEYIGSTARLLPFMRKGKIGFMDTTGIEVIGPVLDDRMRGFGLNLNFVKKKLWAMQNGRWGLINSKGQWLIPPTFETFSGNSNAGAWVSSESGLWGFVDTNGIYLVPPMPLDEPLWQEFKNGSVIVQQNKKYGVLGIGGKWKIPPRSEPIKYGVNNLFWLDNPGKNSVCTDDKGNIVIPESKIYSGADGYLYIFRKGAWSFVNTDGKWIKKPKLEAITEFNSGIAYAKTKGKWGLILENGKWLIPPQYDGAFFPAYQLVKDSNDQRIRFVAPVMVGDGEPWENPKMNQLFWLKKNNIWYLTDTSGHFFPKIAMDTARETRIICHEVFAMATSNKLWQVYKQDGSRLSDIQFEEVYWGNQACSNFSVKSGGKWGSMNKNGNLEFPCISDESIYYMGIRDNKSWVNCYGESFWVNKKWQLSVKHEKK